MTHQPQATATPESPSNPRDRLLAACKTLCLGAVATSNLLGVSENSVWQWRKGKYAAPERLLAWLEWLAGMVKNNPPPGKDTD